METQVETRQLQPAELDLTTFDLHLFREGTHLRLYEKLGAHPSSWHGTPGVHFALWAPHAQRVSVIGDFNHNDPHADMLQPLGDSGIWTGFIPGLGEGDRYHYQIVGGDHAELLKADPFGFRHECPPSTASIISDLSYEWHDQVWMAERAHRQQLDRPISIYELHLGSWMRAPEQNQRFLTYTEIAPRLTEYVQRLGFTHVEFLPVMEHPFYGSWGYHITGFFAPTSRYGTPDEFMYLIDYLHQHHIGVFLDWVPSHFPTDEHGLAQFDGSPLFEDQQPGRNLHPEWKSCLFNYREPQVRSFLLSNAFFWLDKYHIDGLRVDAIASMLYRDLGTPRGRSPGAPPEAAKPSGENTEAAGFLRQLNEEIYTHFPGVQTMAEESTAWPLVSRPTYMGGLGFGYKWDMGFAHDTLKYMAQDPLYRKYHHQTLTFRGMYAFGENFVLPLSHDDVVYGKGSLLAKMPGDEWQKFANVRLLFAHTFWQPGKKLLFMGNEFAQWKEWDHDAALDWLLSDHPMHAGTRKWVADLNHFYRQEPALYEGDALAQGFEWIECHDAEQSTLSWVRRGIQNPNDLLVAALNFTPVPRTNFRLGVPHGGSWRERLNSDAKDYGGSGQGNLGIAEAAPFPWQRRPYVLTITLPPLGGVIFKPEGGH